MSPVSPGPEFTRRNHSYPDSSDGSPIMAVSLSVDSDESLYSMHASNASPTFSALIFLNPTVLDYVVIYVSSKEASDDDDYILPSLEKVVSLPYYDDRSKLVLVYSPMFVRVDVPLLGIPRGCCVGVQYSPCDVFWA